MSFFKKKNAPRVASSWHFGKLHMQFGSLGDQTIGQTARPQYRAVFFSLERSEQFFETIQYRAVAKTSEPISLIPDNFLVFILGFLPCPYCNLQLQKSHQSFSFRSSKSSRADWFSSLMSQDRTREPGRWEPSPAHATSQCLVGWASAARPQRDVVWLQICTHMLPPLLSVHAPRACVLASPEPGSGETSDFCVSREPGSRYLFASRKTGPIAGAANQSAGACIGRAWFGAHAANQTHP